MTPSEAIQDVKQRIETIRRNMLFGEFGSVQQGRWKSDAQELIWLGGILHALETGCNRESEHTRVKDEME